MYNLICTNIVINPTDSVCIVIPVYSAVPSRYELISFNQCFKILGKHPIYVVAPDGLDLRAYKKVVPEFEVIHISKKWLASRLNYNKLKLSQYFYSLFAGYTYLLTYELDAFAFTDDLDYWCSKNYDYIGAPWFDAYDLVKGNILRVGNSGFSLRKIPAIQNGIRHIFYIDPTRFRSIKNTRLLQKSKLVIYKQLNKVEAVISKFYAENMSIQKAAFLCEDRVISELMTRSIKEFNLAPVEDACKFSFEVNPGILYEMNNNTLPMGCHAWWLYDLEFWKPYIESYGYEL